MNRFDEHVAKAEDAALWSHDIATIQVNVGLQCNLTCEHCHVGAGPKRKEQMDWTTMELVIDAARSSGCALVDITGGAPEMNPHLTRFIRALHKYGIRCQVRTNLTILLESGYEPMAQFFADHQVRLTASLPCYLEDNVDAQRGQGVFQDSIAVLRGLNELGYGIREALSLDLVYNPRGATLPPNQATLEADYRQALRKRYGIVFSRLITITNMPIGRYWMRLRKEGRAADYMTLLEDAFNPATLPGLMCRHQISVDWNGLLYDCDFNLALKLPLEDRSLPHIRDFCESHAVRRISTGGHCFGCTAGCGSSCGGALA
ncbi:radical SAM/Cys-rich domain protein [bacterium]|nr:radical SAM/Cys-rich domain protein [bacterium]